MRNAQRFEIGSQHLMAKGTLKVKNYFEENGILYMVYTLNEDPTEHTNKYVNVISIIYKWQKKNGITNARNLSQFVELTLKRSLKFGVEMELLVPDNISLIEKLEEAGVKVTIPNSTHEVVNGWKIVRDASIRATRGYEGVELVAPPSTNFDDLAKVCKVLKEIKAKVNSSCGLHVHHDISDLKRRQIMRVYNFYNKYSKVINSMMPKHRITNRYCRPVASIINRVNNCETKEDLLVKIAGKGSRMYYNSCRYYVLNLRSFLYYGTIEFRQGFASIDFDIISNWILFTHKIIERALEIENDVVYNIDELSMQESFDEMIKEIKVERTKLEENLKNRLKKYGRDAA